ncbi:FAD-dependent oxidoreductase [Deltaproteobacteria bacterium OttesenSCG-928-M10]|nr:FAD-dependent oxidoreductase [Deltaproteobacteria bacterium OttesenSCG-928-M10]
MSFTALFQPIIIGNMTVPNRLVMPAMGTNYADPDGRVSAKMRNYYAANAKGGFGLITIEITAVDPLGKAGEIQPGLWCDDQIDSFRQLAESIHAHGAKMSVQLHHAGRQSHGVGGHKPFAPSLLPCPVMRTMPTELTTDGTYRLIECFVAAAKRAQAAGADAIEIHGAHGYLIAEYMSPYSNKRLDEFGGNFQNRMRFPTMIVRGIRKALGDDFPILFRISADEKTVGGRTLPETRAMSRLLEDCGVNALHVSAGTYGSMNWIWGASDAPLAYMADFAEDVKKSVKIPVITSGRINDPHIAEELISSGRVDLVSIGRQSLADHQFPAKVRSGRLDEIAPCIGCHQGCTGKLLAGSPISCVVDPFTGENKEELIKPAQKPRRVMIVGGGPAGLLCAWIAAERGHKVTLYEKESVLGGQFRIAAFPPGKSDLLKMLRYYYVMGVKYGVQYRISQVVTPELIAEQKPDVVILATGGVPLVPPIPGIDNNNILHAIDVLSGRREVGQNVLIAGGGLVGSELADYLNEYGHKVTIIEMRPEVGADVNHVVKMTLMKRLKEHETKFIVNATIKNFLYDGAIYELNGQELTAVGYDSIVLALGTTAHNPLEKEISGLVEEVHVLGDAKKARKVLEATSEAANLAISL